MITFQKRTHFDNGSQTQDITDSEGAVYARIDRRTRSGLWFVSFPAYGPNTARPETFEAPRPERSFRTLAQAHGFIRRTYLDTTERGHLMPRKYMDSAWSHDADHNPNWKPSVRRRVFRCQECGNDVEEETNHTGSIYQPCKGRCRHIANPNTARERVFRKTTRHIYARAVL